VIAKPPSMLMRIGALVLVIALATVLAALAFEHLGGYAPCPLCIEERYAYYFAVPVGAAAILFARGELAGVARVLLLLIALAFLANMAAGIYHAGVEWKWWPGPDTCTAPMDISKLSTDALMQQIMTAPLVRCDEIVWQFLGLSMAGWNAVISLGLAGLWLVSVIWSPNPYDSSSASQ
jgi:disulfide bond formation protein DsbB